MSKLLPAAALAAAALLAAGHALAAKPRTQKQYAELRLKQAMNSWARKKVPGLTIDTVSCVLPKNGVVVRCTARASAPKYREKVVFGVKETLHPVGTMTWLVTSEACSDSKTGGKLRC
jgi:hypothetical protein